MSSFLNLNGNSTLTVTNSHFLSFVDNIIAGPLIKLNQAKAVTIQNVRFTNANVRNIYAKFSDNIIIKDSVFIWENNDMGVNLELSYAS